MLIPMTLAMAWGLTSGTLLTLIWVPPAYGILEDILALSGKISGALSNKVAGIKEAPKKTPKEARQPLAEPQLTQKTKNTPADPVKA